MKSANSESLLGLTATLAVLALGTCPLAATAATGIDEDCPETRAAIVAEISPPSLQVDAAEHVADPATRVADDAAARPLDSGRETQTSALMRELPPRPVDDSESLGSDEATTRDLPPTETRLPGIADEDLPRFRRQMFRTDI